ncbi:hypothetical protein C8R44DRAFT_624268 [Mycena epipterygia]|nr:hypothetical protein C8R44DRAFT_624268 [Mycena epipterygia]
MSESPTTRVKRARYTDSLTAGASRVRVLKQNAPVFTTRTLPTAQFVISPDFPLFYRRFPLSSYFQVGGSECAGSLFVLQHSDWIVRSACTLFGVPHPGGQYNAPRDAFDLYTPRFVRGRGVDKMGLCPICIEQPQRGGEGKKVWLAMKSSVFNYHMHYYHGISASSARPLLPPTDFRIVARPAPKKTERAEVQQGKCHKCLSWVAVQTVKDMEVKVKELFWWKHAVACHGEDVSEGAGDVFEEDRVYEVLKEMR